MTRFVLASGNRHKLGEFAAILAPHEVVAMPAGVVLPPEGTESFADNARDKVRALAAAVAADPALAARLADEASGGLLFIADDSGLEVEALGWAPGVTSARYAGVDGPGADAANVARLLGELDGFAGPLARRARFVCALVAVTPRMEEYAVTGYWWGAIAEAPRGEGGFGYDPVFVPEGSDLTVAQWPQEQKDQASHRALAGTALLERLHQEGLLDEPDRERRPHAG
ncbi:MAG: non-canonical purine NTP pyrophosphatase [Thermoleophilia bacterium]|jgi:XTP/dITP diphosphohydrolase|nr:non-canonical purine NTP pyrophosphatase [Thermoleophilia bacterium]